MHYETRFSRRNSHWDLYSPDPERHPRHTSGHAEPTCDTETSRGERRHHPRQDVACRADYASTRQYAGVGLIKNASLDGMFMEHALGLHVGDSVTTVFSLPDSRPLKLQVIVKWVGPKGAGLQLKGLSRQITSLFGGSLESESVTRYRSWLCQQN